MSEATGVRLHRVVGLGDKGGRQHLSNFQLLWTRYAVTLRSQPGTALVMAGVDSEGWGSSTARGVQAAMWREETVRTGHGRAGSPARVCAAERGGSHSVVATTVAMMAAVRLTLPYSCPSPSRVSSRFPVVCTANCTPFVSNLRFPPPHTKHGREAAQILSPKADNLLKFTSEY